MSKGYFITGTDTEIGKTWCSLGLIARFQLDGHRCAAMKPVASGCQRTTEGLRNDDALKLQAQASSLYPYAQVNPYAFEPAIAPHVAAAEAGVSIDAGHIINGYEKLAAENDITIVEGVGGWRVPLGGDLDVAGLASALQLPVILVVGLRLGCINHALLSAESIRAHGCTLAGWIANSLSAEMPRRDENIRAINERINAPLLGTVPYLEHLSPSAIAASLNIEL